MAIDSSTQWLIVVIALFVGFVIAEQMGWITKFCGMFKQKATPLDFKSVDMSSMKKHPTIQSIINKHKPGNRATQSKRKVRFDKPTMSKQMVAPKRSQVRPLPESARQASKQEVTDPSSIRPGFHMEPHESSMFPMSAAEDDDQFGFLSQGYP